MDNAMADHWQRRQEDLDRTDRRRTARYRRDHVHTRYLAEMARDDDTRNPLEVTARREFLAAHAPLIDDYRRTRDGRRRNALARALLRAAHRAGFLTEALFQKLASEPRQVREGSWMLRGSEV